MCGIRSQTALEQLLEEPYLKLDNAIQIAQSSEAADLNTKKLKGAESTTQTTSGQAHHAGPTKTPVGRADCGYPRQQGKPCYRCGSKDHFASNCLGIL